MSKSITTASAVKRACEALRLSAEEARKAMIAFFKAFEKATKDTNAKR